MAVIDYGTILIKNGALLDAGAVLVLADRFHFYKLTLSDQHTPHSTMPGYYESYSLYYALDAKKKMVATEVVGGIEFRMKRVGQTIYRVHFTFEGDKYVALQGYDVDLKTFWNVKRTKPVVDKFLKEYLKTPLPPLPKQVKAL